jgi:hypothetical protein
MCVPLVTSACAPMMLPLPMTAPSRIVAPMPMRHSSSTVQACRIARWPTVTSLPTRVGRSSARWTMLPSWMFEPSPISMKLMSPRRTLMGQTLLCAASRTSPITTACGGHVGGRVDLRLNVKKARAFGRVHASFSAASFFCPVHARICYKGRVGLFISGKKIVLGVALWRGPRWRRPISATRSAIARSATARPRTWAARCFLKCAWSTGRLCRRAVRPIRRTTFRSRLL